jgi:hypothetical protein
MSKQRYYSTFRKDIEELLKFQKTYLRLGVDGLKEIDVTIGVTPTEEGFSWGYQTGDNSFTGGAYGHPNWVRLYVTRSSNCKELSKDAVNQLKDLLAQSASS